MVEVPAKLRSAVSAVFPSHKVTVRRDLSLVHARKVFCLYVTLPPPGIAWGLQLDAAEVEAMSEGELVEKLKAKWELTEKARNP